MAHQRTRKIPRKLLSWGIMVIAIVAVVMVVIRYRQNPKGERIANKEAKEQKTIEQAKPGDPDKLIAALNHSADEAVKEKVQQQEKDRQERLRASLDPNDTPVPATASASQTSSQNNGNGGHGGRPDWAQIPGRQPTGSPNTLDQYEQAKLRVQQTATSAQQLTGSSKIAAWEADDNSSQSVKGLTGNNQLDAVLAQIGRNGQAGMNSAAGAVNPDAPATDAIDKLVTAQTQAAQAANNQGSRAQVHANEDWSNKVAERKPETVATARPPLSPYTLYRDDWIPCGLMGTMNSDMPGDIGCQVIRNVYDSVTGKILLIPKYSILSGPYNSDVNAGQERLLVAFHRLRYPSGATVDLGAMSGADTSGQSGIPADANSHFWSIFGSAFLITGLSELVSRNQSSSGTSITINSSANTFSGAAGAAMLDTVKRILDRNSGIKPTLTTQGATQILVYVNRDLVLPPQVTLTHP